MKVCGVDPAPGKGLQVFDGEDRTYPVERARGFLETIRHMGEVLVTWDAPLSGPPACVLDGAGEMGPAFTQRPIDSFFRQAAGLKAPKGISVQGYGGCPHWTISRSLLGLPRVGPYDAPASSLPFLLASADQGQRPSSGCHVAEVHPAVALWLWCRGRRDDGELSWEYKRDDDVLHELWRVLTKKTDAGRVLGLGDSCTDMNDDELDARVAYALGRLWLDDPESVVLLGDLDTGTFLVPRVDGIVEGFEKFVAKNAPRAMK